MNDYTQWEQEVTQQVADLKEISYADAAGIVEGQEFVMQQAWTQNLGAHETAGKLLEAA